MVKKIIIIELNENSKQYFPEYIYLHIYVVKMRNKNQWGY